MTSIAWHASGDDNSSDDDNVMLLPPTNFPSSSSQLYGNDAESACIQRRSGRANSWTYKEKMIQNAKDERKYKTSIVSVLIIGICLILMVNIGLGIKSCSNLQVQDKPLVSSNHICIDKTTKQRFPWQHYRLPTTVLPDSYHLHIHPNLTLQSYTAQVTINLTIHTTTSYIVLHSRNQSFTSVTIHALSNPLVKKQSQKTLHCESYQTVAFDFGFELQQGEKYQLIIDFHGSLTFSLGGFYISKYKKPDGTEKVIGTTQFESTDARAAFPCFDEPKFKANFSLSFIRDPNMITLFNMPLSRSTVLDGGLVKDIFPSTVKMSTYLVAFVVSDFKYVTKNTANGVKVSVYSRPDKVDELNFALDIAVDVLEYYDQLFKIPFPLPKLDLVAIPDFAAGAMENWGLVTYRETALLYNPATSSVGDQEWVAIVIAHELSHQWFGNLVTMKWWSDLWLNEGFATYMEYAGVNHIKPQWKIMGDFVVDVVLRAMTTDVSRFTHPLSQRVTDSHQINEMFDDISYQKGASMISMLDDYLGKTFFKGVNSYLKKYSYKNADNHDLLAAISGQDNGQHPNLLNLMQTWTTQSGFPLLRVSAASSKITVEQSRFLYPTNQTASRSTEVWKIPLSYITDKSSSTKHFFLSKQKDVFDVGDFKWIKFNHNFTGFYKVSYDGHLWQQLVTQMNANHFIFSPSDRISILSDAFSMAHLGDLDYSKLFSLLQYLKHEKSYAPVSVALSGIGYIGSMIKFNLKEEEKKIFHSYVADLFAPLYNELAWKNKSSLNREQSKLQSSVVSAMCSIDYEPCVSRAYAKFLDWKNRNATLNPGDMTTIFRTAVIHGVPSDWEYLWLRFIKSTDPNLNVKLLHPLASSRNITRILFLQNELLGGVNIRSQSLTTVLLPMTSNVIGSMLLWRFLREHWDDLLKTYPIAGFSMRRVVRECLFAMVSRGEEESARAFFQSKGLANIKFIKRSLETSQINAHWSQSRLSTVLRWLEVNKSSWTSARP